MSAAHKALLVGVAGVGHLGSVHARLWKQHDGVEFVGVFDTDEARCREIAEEHSVRAFASYAELLSSIDALSLVTPTSTHASLGYEALHRGIHCFIEKPITATFAEAGPLIDEAQRQSLVLQVGHVERFNPAILALDPTDLEPMFIESHRMAQFKLRATDVAVVHDLMIHDIDLVLHLVRSPVVEVRASGVAVVSDTIDIANARLEFANGCVANLTASRISQRPMRKMRLFRRDAYISVDFAKPGVEVFRISDKDDSMREADGIAPTSASMLLGDIDLGTRRRAITYEQPQLENVNAIAREHEEFVNAIRAGSQPPVTGSEAAAALRVAEEIVAQIAERGIAEA
ncbi:MAG: Gfo/Idh/MocA family oxidoreductase [bacterium]|nr:Gfo/Idh/MocA family oxidoreductase [Candidatus Kapabacteria bacterium]